MNQKRVAALPVAAFLFGCAFSVTFDPATADLIAASSGAANTPAIFAKAAESVLPAAAGPGTIEPRGRAYLFRGFGGSVLTHGMDNLGKLIEQAGVTVRVNDFYKCRAIAEQAIRDYRQDSEPIAVAGHSIGAACALTFAEILRAEGVPIGLIVTFDPARIASDVPTNVERYINIFQSTSLFGGRDVAPAEGYQGHFASFDVAEHKELNHINIEYTESLHEQVATKILQLAATPANAEGEAVPIRYVVPGDATIDLWDSGTPVYAPSGDTLQTLATLYDVPLWSLTQINRVSDSTPLAPGQRVVVPRHLVPLLASNDSGQVPSKH